MMPPALRRRGGKARRSIRKCDDGRGSTALRIRRRQRWHRQHDSCLSLPPRLSDSSRRRQPARGQAAGPREHRVHRIGLFYSRRRCCLFVAMFCEVKNSLASLFFFFFRSYSLDSLKKTKKPKTQKTKDHQTSIVYIFSSHSSTHARSPWEVASRSGTPAAAGPRSATSATREEAGRSSRTTD